MTGPTTDFARVEGKARRYSLRGHFARDHIHRMDLARRLLPIMARLAQSRYIPAESQGAQLICRQDMACPALSRIAMRIRG